MMTSSTWLARLIGNGVKISDGTATKKNRLDQMSLCVQVWSAKVDKIDHNYRSLILTIGTVYKAMVIELTVSQTFGSFSSMQAGGIFQFLARASHEYH